MSKSWFEKVVDGIKDFFEWLGSDKTRQTVEGILRLVVLVAGIAEKFNAPLSGPEKARLVRQMVQLLRYASPEELAELNTIVAYLSATGQLARIEPWELDKLCGDGIAAFVATQKVAYEPGRDDCPAVETIKGQY